MRFGSLFSGIEAASCAWLPLGWTCAWVSEIDPFACAVLKHHYPDTPNLGDITEIDWHAVEPVDIVVGGPPCQDFSVAGQRAGHTGSRGNLSLAYVDALDAIDPAWSLTENVPGWLSMADNSFGRFLAAMVGSGAPLIPRRGQRWTDAGLVAGPKRTAAWRVLDAQFHGVPQRRRRVFVVAVRGAGNWACAEALFPQRQSVQRDFAPRREAGQNAPAKSLCGSDGGIDREDRHSLIAGFNNTGQGWWNDADVATGLRDMSAGSGSKEATLIVPPLMSRSGRGGSQPLSPGFQTDEHIVVAADVACPVTSNPYGDHESREGLLIAIPNHAPPKQSPDHFEDQTFITHCLRADGFDAGEDGTGRGDSHDLEYREDGIANAVLTPNGGRAGIGVGAVAYGIRSDAAREGSALTPSPDAEGRVRLRDPGFNLYEETAPTLDSAPHAVAYGIGSDAIDRSGEGAAGNAAERSGLNIVENCQPSLRARPNNSVAQAMSVRRLTPRECERLQGFEDDWTLVQYRGKPAADGNRYRAIGNSMAVPVIHWLGRQIQRVDAA